MASSWLSYYKNKCPCHSSITGIPESLLLSRKSRRNCTMHLDQIATRSLHENHHQERQPGGKLTAFGYWLPGYFAEGVGRFK
jgi:hypothetical protein